MPTISRPRVKAQVVIDRCQVEIVDLKGTYVCNAGIKSGAAILDGAEPFRVEEFPTPFSSLRVWRRSPRRAITCCLPFIFGQSFKIAATLVSELSVFSTAMPTIRGAPAS